MNTATLDTHDLYDILKRLKLKFGTFAKIAEELDICQAYIHNFMSGKRKPSKMLIKSLRDKGYLPSLPKRIRSQITWESEKQKEFFQKFVVERGFNSLTEYCRDIADQRIEWKYVYIGWDAIWKDE